MPGSTCATTCARPASPKSSSWACSSWKPGPHPCGSIRSPPPPLLPPLVPLCLSIWLAVCLFLSAQGACVCVSFRHFAASGLVLCCVHSPSPECPSSCLSVCCSLLDVYRRVARLSAFVSVQFSCRLSCLYVSLSIVSLPLSLPVCH